MLYTIFQLFTDVWHLARKYEFRRLSEAQWEAFVGRGMELHLKYKKAGKGIETLYRDLFGAVQKLYIRVGEENG